MKKCSDLFILMSLSTAAFLTISTNTLTIFETFHLNICFKEEEDIMNLVSPVIGLILAIISGCLLDRFQLLKFFFIFLFIIKLIILSINLGFSISLEKRDMFDYEDIGSSKILPNEECCEFLQDNKMHVIFFLTALKSLTIYLYVFLIVVLLVYHLRYIGNNYTKYSILMSIISFIQLLKLIISCIIYSKKMDNKYKTILFISGSPIIGEIVLCILGMILTFQWKSIKMFSTKSFYLRMKKEVLSMRMMWLLSFILFNHIMIRFYSILIEDKIPDESYIEQKMTDFLFNFGFANGLVIYYMLNKKFQDDKLINSVIKSLIALISMLCIFLHYHKNIKYKFALLHLANFLISMFSSMKLAKVFFYLYENFTLVSYSTVIGISYTISSAIATFSTKAFPENNYKHGLITVTIFSLVISYILENHAIK